MRRVFYIVAGIAVALAFVNATWKFLNSTNDDPNPSHYVYMPPAERGAEYRSLLEESQHPSDMTPEGYFKVMARFARLEDATKRAHLEEPTRSSLATSAGPKGMPLPFDDIPNLGFLQNNYMGATHYSIFRKVDQARFDKAIQDSGIKLIKEHRMPMDPLEPMAWAIFYGAGLLFTFGHFALRINAMGGNWWLAMLSDYRFPLWLMAWPVGVFRYPMDVDVRQQLVRAYRFVTFLLTSSLSLAAVGCVGKRVKTEPDEQRVDAAHTLHLNISTTTWPKYIGGNGGVFHPDPIQETAATLSLPQGFYLGTWTSLPLGGRDIQPNFGYEIDGSAGWSGARKGFGLNGDFTWVGVTPLAKYRGDVLQFTTTVDRNLKMGNGQTITPFSILQVAFPSQGSEPKSGLFFKEGLRWNWQRGKFSGGASSEMTHDSGAFGFDAGWITRGRISIGRRLNSHMRIEAPLQWSTPISRMDDGRKTEFQAGLSLAWQR